MPNEAAPLQKLIETIQETGEEPDRGEILDRFLAYCTELGFELYAAQEQAILELLEWRHVILNTPTGSGKSLVAQFLHFQATVERRKSFYTSPIKALVNEKFFDLCEAFGAENVGLLTGDASVNRDAPIVCCTAEILANMALRDPKLEADYVVMDEFHFYGDRERGSAWQIPLITLRDTAFLLMSATLGDMSAIVSRLEAFTDRKVALVMGAERPVPLSFEYREAALQETIEELIKSSEAPVYLVNFTQRSCAENAQALTSIQVTTREERDAIGPELALVRFETPYGKELQRFLRAGIGVHHAGLLPKYRLLVEKLSQAGLLKVISGTDSLGVGVNIPIRTVLFTSLSKFNGERTALLTAREFHQLAGRAGRKGFDDHGRVVALAPEHVAENKKLEAKRLKSPHLKNKLVNKKPPKGFVHYDDKTFGKLIVAPPEPLEPRFDVTHGMIIQVLQADDDKGPAGYGRLVEIIRRTHLREPEQRRQLKLAARLFRSLRDAQIVELVRGEEGRGSTVRVAAHLQRDFSLHQALSLYLVEVIDFLDRDAETWALDVLTLVESILEDPAAVLMRQVDRIKDELVARLKAEGVEYEERMAQLEKVEHPKPNAEFIYDTFNIFAKNHPWVGAENIRPKSVARDMYEKCLGFNDYVKDLGIARSEGVLLRYLSQVYKTCVQNVPERYQNESFSDVVSFLRTVLMHVDSSLIEEWEAMMRGEIVRPRDRLRMLEPARPADLASDFKAFSRRIRNELFLLLKCFADKAWGDAPAFVRSPAEDPWTADRFAAALEPYFAEHASIDVSPRARHVQNTILRDDGPRRWTVLHKIMDPEGDEDWVVEGIIDLDDIQDESLPLVELRRIGT